MKFSKFVPIFLLIFGAFTTSNNLYSEDTDPTKYKILSSKNDQLSIVNVQKFLDEGDLFINSGDFDKAKESYDKARNLAKQLSGFYRDLNGSFRGLDARIPREMDDKGRKSLKIWADTNSRLAALFKRKKQPEVAVPLLIEIIRIMSPTSVEGKKAYNELIELGFVETPFKGF
tara:strand:- start:1236 stop:1754 length:519 start_codon:yes stop_codon:yes gene_type:complete